MVPGLPGVFGTDVALVVEAIILNADARHRDRGHIMDWLLHNFTKPMQSSFNGFRLFY